MLPSLLVAIAAQSPSANIHFMAPAGDEPARVAYGKTSILPNGRFLTPEGPRLYTGENLFHVALSPEGDTVVGFHGGGITIYTDLKISGGVKKEIPLKEVAPAGIFSPNGMRLYVSLGDEGTIAIYDVPTWQLIGKIDLNVRGKKDSYANDLVLSKDGQHLFAVDVANQEVVTAEISTRTVIAREKAGRQPYALSLSEDGKSLFVANIGIFDYSVVKGLPGGNPRGISRPAFGFPSREATLGVEFEGKKIPGLGSPLAPDAQSIWMYSLSTGIPKFSKSVKSGLLIQAPTSDGRVVGGSAPNAMLVRGGRLFVSNANNDTVQVFSTSDLSTLATWKLSPIPEVARLRGVIPSGLALSPDGKRLYVCESGLNSVAAIDTSTGRTIGRIPTGWFPTSIKVAGNGSRLYIGTQKGLGRGPRGPLHLRTQFDERFGLADMPGMIHVAATPRDAGEFGGTSQAVLRNNGLVVQKSPAPKFPKEIKHVVYVIKENHTFDGIFGDLAGANGEPAYAEFGMKGWIAEKGKGERLPMMPNHHRLASQFSISDNFYMEPQASGDGHRWIVGVYPSLWTTRVFYAGWDFKLSDETKGRLPSFGSNGSQIPEDYLENGSLWEHLERGGISFRNYGEGFEFPAQDEGLPESRSGNFEVANYPMPKVLFDNTCFEFPVYNTNIPDIARIDWFIDDVNKTFRARGKPLPGVMTIALSNDHGDRPRPDRGYPYVGSYMADNDLALGRLIEYLSRTPEWKNMAIFVTQDDSGGDNDHVDRHRSFVLAISPYAKRGYVSHRHTSIMSIVRSIYSIMGLGPNNMFDALASPLDDMFTDQPDFTPYTHTPVDPRVFKPEETFDPQDPKFEKRRGERPTRMDDPSFFEWLRNRGKA